MDTAELDFYAPAVDHQKVRRERLGQQREAMFSWRNGHQSSPSSQSPAQLHETSSSATTAGAKQVILGDSERARAAQAAEKESRERGGALWDSAIGQARDRRRDWRLTGFGFTQDHFRTSTDPSSAYHPRNRAQRRLLTLSEARRELEADPYVPYVHDQILLSGPSQGSHVTAIAVTMNSEEARLAEVDAAAHGTERQRGRSLGGGGQLPLDGTQTFGTDGSGPAGGADPVEAWHAALGGGVASRQRAAQTAEAMYSELMAQQASLTGTAYGSPESRNVHVPTGELAYTVRPAFLDSHADRTYRGGRRWTLSRTSASDGTAAHAVDGHGSTSTRTPGTRRASHGSRPEDHGPSQGLNTTLDSETTVAPQSRLAATGSRSLAEPGDAAGDGDGAIPLVHTAAEAKSMRVYAVDLRRRTTNSDTSMVTRNEPVRRGVPVLLPDAWVFRGAEPES